MGLHFAQDIFPLPDLRPPTGSYITIVGVSCERWDFVVIVIDFEIIKSVPSIPCGAEKN